MFSPPPYRLALNFVRLVLLLIVCTTCAFSQSQITGRLAGTITDEKRAVIIGAQVVAVSRATNDERIVVTDAAGNYNVSLLLPGAYRVSVNFTQILALSPGTSAVLPDNTALGRNSLNVSVNGARVTQNNFQLNGVDANNIGNNAAGLWPVPAPETIQEFTVQTSLYDATFGRGGGGSVQAVTRTGSNAFR